MSGEKDKIAVLQESTDECLISQNLIGIKLKKSEILETYLLNYMQFENFLNYIILESNVTTLKSLRLDVLRDAHVPLPSMDEQKKIVEYMIQKITR